jgi:hypothetical protein
MPLFIAPLLLGTYECYFSAHNELLSKTRITAKQKKQRSRNEWFTLQPNGGGEPHP